MKNLYMSAGVPQHSTLSPLLYLLYVADIPTPLNCIPGQFADDMAILSVALQGRVVQKKLLDGHFLKFLVYSI